MIINMKGDVIPWCHCTKTVGNVSQNTLNEIWNNNLMREYRKRILNKDCKEFCDFYCPEYYD